MAERMTQYKWFWAWDFEKLERWQEALDVYDARLTKSPSDTEALLGSLRCLYSLLR